MKIQRGELLARLNEAEVGLSSKEVLEQSNSFVFKDEFLITFNDAVMVRTKNPFDFNAVVPAADLLILVGKIPDEEIEISLQDQELRIKGKKKSAGFSCTTEILLPFDVVPDPSGWNTLTEPTSAMLQQAARTCGHDQTQFLSTCVHITPERIEACDNFRLLRFNGATGFSEEVLIPAHNVEVLEGLGISDVCVGKGWVHFRTESRAVISVRCSHEDYHKGIDDLLVMNNPEPIILPSTLKEIVERAEIFNVVGYDATVNVCIEEGVLTLTSRKEGGWYKERKKVRYDGKPLGFNVHPKFLTEILARTQEVQVDDNKMKIVTDGIQFVVTLGTRGPVKKEEGDE